jgi:hypothetical protein
MARGDKFLDAIQGSCDAVLSALEATEARVERVGRAVLRETREGEHEVIELARQWVNAPTNYVDNLFALLDMQGRAQHRTIELTRDTFKGAREYAGEMQSAMSQLVEANGTVGEAALKGLRHVVERGRGAAPPEKRRPAKLTRISVANGSRVA